MITGRISTQSRNGFTLIELLAVILIIVLLAGMTIAALPGIQSRINRSSVETFLAELEAALSRYQLDNGIYPVNVPGGESADARETVGREGSKLLYRHLSGDWDSDGLLYVSGGSDIERDPDDEKMPIYFEKLNWGANYDAKLRKSLPKDLNLENWNPNTSARSNVEIEVVDSFNSAIRYLAHKPNTKDKLTKNPTYDIWSIVGTDPTRANEFEVQAQYITNWSGN